MFEYKVKRVGDTYTFKRNRRLKARLVILPDGKAKVECAFDRTGCLAFTFANLGQGIEKCEDYLRGILCDAQVTFNGSPSLELALTGM